MLIAHLIYILPLIHSYFHMYGTLLVFRHRRRVAEENRHGSCPPSAPSLGEGGTYMQPHLEEPLKSLGSCTSFGEDGIVRYDYLRQIYSDLFMRGVGFIAPCTYSSASVLGSQGCHYQITTTPNYQIWQFEPLGGSKRQKFILTVLDSRSPKSRCQPGCALSESSRGEHAPCLSLSFWCCWQPLVFWLCGHITPIPVSDVTWCPPCVSSPLIRTPVTLDQAHPNSVSILELEETFTKPTNSWKLIEISVLS